MPITDRYGSRGRRYVVVFLLTRLLVPSERPTVRERVLARTASTANWYVCDMISRAFVGHGRCLLKAERLGATGAPSTARPSSNPDFCARLVRLVICRTIKRRVQTIHWPRVRGMAKRITQPGVLSFDNSHRH